MTKTLMRNAKMTSAVLLTVLVWLTMPMAVLSVEPKNVSAISGKNRDNTPDDKLIANTSMVKDGTNSRLGDSISETFSPASAM